MQHVQPQYCNSIGGASSGVAGACRPVNIVRASIHVAQAIRPPEIGSTGPVPALMQRSFSGD